MYELSEMRTFIAIPIPDDIKSYLADIQSNLGKCNLEAKWINTNNIHITLKFLGEIEPEKIPSIQKTIENTAKNFLSLDLKLTEFGFFPNPRNPRVFFISTNQEKKLQEIAYRLEEELETLGFEKEFKFKNHLTLARFKGRKNLSSLIEKIQTIKIEQSFPANQIILYQSTLTPTGPIYKKLFMQTLK